MQNWSTWALLIMLILLSLGGLLVHTYASRGTAHQAYGGTSAVRRRSVSDDEVMKVNRDIRRRANLTITPALLGVLLLCWFIAPGVAVPLWAKAIAVLLLFAACIPLMRKEDIIKSLGR
ncbi:hypothetical protein [Ornithinimicrobium pratense]|uniref:Uncharacterized protein n=1 Tax=Ornithinimicrobium pratense TaxID=2593973 RepID=A0A5J6V626_9MICO|nr:hypothetical protein [Ornithinimicrobium pratense]QFG68631.1 hypothetical protein FY030_07785 [Ornithinimicrobium pratense]